MSAKLYLNFPQTDLRREVSPDGEIIFGRTSASDIDLTGYFEGHPKTISRQHFKISYSKGEGFILVDLSLNGTRVNEVNLAPGERRILRHGDVMKLASDENLVITISIEADPDITDTIDIKVAALRCHKSQVGDRPEIADWMKQMARMSAEGQDYEFAEAFHREEVRW